MTNRMSKKILAHIPIFLTLNLFSCLNTPQITVQPENKVENKNNTVVNNEIKLPSTLPSSSNTTNIEASSPLKASEIRVDQTEIQLAEGEQKLLKAEVILSDGSINREVTWLSSNTKRVSVGPDGIAQRLMGGEVTLTAISKLDTSLTVSIKVNDASFENTGPTPVFETPQPINSEPTVIPPSAPPTVPFETPTPAPPAFVPSPTPVPVITPTPVPVSTSTPTPVPTPTPTPTPTPISLSASTALQMIRDNGRRLLDVVVKADGVYALTLQKYSGLRTNPDNTKFYESDVFVEVVYYDGTRRTHLLNPVQRIYVIDPDQNTGAIQVLASGTVLAFANHRPASGGPGGYAMDGTLYTLNPGDSTGSSQSVFTAANMGWFPRFDGSDILHFNFSGYYMMRNTAQSYSIQPVQAQQEYIAAQKAKSDNLFP